MDNKRNRFALDSMDLDFANEILEDNGYQELKLTNKRKMILATLLYINGIDEKDSQGYFFVENLYLCQLIGVSERALITSLNYFNEIGIISRISGKRGSASLYKFNEKTFSDKLENFSHNFSDDFSNKCVDNQVVREFITENFSNNLSKTSVINFSDNLENFSTDIDKDIEEDKDIDKEIELKKDIEKNINNIYNINLINILNNINNNLLIIKEKNNKKEKEIEDMSFKLEALIQKVDKFNNKDNFEIIMKNNKENIIPSQDVLEVILTKLTSIEERITAIEEDIKSLKGQNCAVTSSIDSSNIITPIEEYNAADGKEMASDTIDCIPTEVINSEIEEKETKIEKRSIPTFVNCEVKLTSKDIKKDTESPRKTFTGDLTASNDVSGTIVPQAENKSAEAKRISDEEWEKFVNEVDSKSSSKKNITRDVMGSFVPCASIEEGWVDGKKKFSSLEEVDKEIAVWKGKGLDIMQIATRFKVNKETFTMEDKLYSPSKVSSQIEVNVKKEEINTPSEEHKEVDKDTEKEVVEEVHKNTEENVYYAETNTVRFERENDDFTSTEEALDNIFSSDYTDDEEMPMSKLKEELEKRKQEAAVEVPF